VGQKLFMPGILSTAGIETVRSALTRAMASGAPLPFEVGLMLPDGNSVTVEAKCHPVEWDGLACLEVILRDITDRRKGEA
jgi:PAS domain-containing protein